MRRITGLHLCGEAPTRSTESVLSSYHMALATPHRLAHQTAAITKALR
jgi:hypothetical protein